MSRCFIKFPISGLGEPYIYHNLEDFTSKRDVDITLRVSDCEELSGGG